MDPTKFLPPQPSHALERERLLARLHAWENKKLVIIHAQAGQGKSTLAAEYQRSLNSPAVWYTLDAGDDDPAVFLPALGKAVRRLVPDSRDGLPPLPQRRYGFGDMHQAVALWVGQVFQAITGPCLVVLDDYHSVAGSPDIRSVLKVLFETAPPGVRFLLLSRTRPQLDIVRLRARQAVAELSTRDLLFSDGEVQDLFSLVFGMPIDTAAARAVNRTAEGWPAGLVLIHEYLVSAPSQEIAAILAGRGAAVCRTHIFDYLAQEVFAHLPVTLREFLLHTSVATTLTVPLMATLSGLPSDAASPRPSVTSMLSELRQRNLFITDIDGSGTAIRYHAVFRDFLLKKLAAAVPSSDVRKLFSLASGHERSCGNLVAAVDLLLESGQTDRAIAQIEADAATSIARGRTRTLLRWIESLPPGRRDRPWFHLAAAVADRFSDPRSARRLFDRALAGFQSDRSGPGRIHGQMLALCGIIETCFYAGGDFKRMARAAAMARTLLNRVRKQPPGLRARMLLALGMAYFFTGRLGEGADHLEQALRLFHRQKDPFHQINSAIYLAPCAIYRGDFAQARDAVRKGFSALSAVPDDRGGEAALFMARAMTALFQGSFAEAQESIDACLRLSREHGLEAFQFLSLDIGGWLGTARGEHAEAETLLTECRRKGDDKENGFFSASASHLLAVNYLHQGRLAEAQAECSRALVIRSRSGSRLFPALSRAVMGAIHRRAGKTALAERELTRALRTLRSIGASQQQANAHLLLALVHRDREHTREFHRHLEAGFRIGQERGFTYYTLVSGDDLRDLARKALELGICEHHCNSLLNGQGGEAGKATIRIFCLGGFRVEKEGRTVSDARWKSRRAKTLIKMLASRNGRGMTRDAVTERLWPDAPPEKHPAQFSSLLHRVRKVLDGSSRNGESGSVILSDGAVVHLDREKVWTDVGAFLLAAEEAKALRSRDDAQQALKACERAIALYEGEFLPSDLFEDWTTPVREQFKRLSLKTIEDAAELSESLGEQKRAGTLHETLFSMDPCHEKACRWLMTRDMADGRRGEAIRTYERCELALRKELDIEPDDQTKKLYRSIIGG